MATKEVLEQFTLVLSETVALVRQLIAANQAEVSTLKSELDSKVNEIAELVAGESANEATAQNLLSGLMLLKEEAAAALPQPIIDVPPVEEPA